MKHCIFTDPHCHPFTNFGTGEQRVQRTLDAIGRIKHFCLSQQIKSVICLGDVFHSRSATKFEYFNKTFECFRSFANSVDQFVILAGNHDLVNRQGSITTIDTFSSFARVELSLLDQGMASYLDEDHRILLAPYCNDWASFAATLSKVELSETILLGHLDLVGAKVAKGWISDKGFDPDIFKRFKLVLLGHFHLRQKLKENIFYIGTCCPQNFGEESEPGYFCTLDDETYEVQWYTTGAPRFLTWDPKNTENHIIGQLPQKGNYVKIIAEPSSELDKVMEERGALVWIYAPEKKKQKVIIRQKGISPEATNEEIVRAYATVHANELPVEELVKVGMELFGDG